MNNKLFDQENWPTNRYSHERHFQENLWVIWRTGLDPKSFEIYQSTANNQKLITAGLEIVLFALLKLSTAAIKNSKYYLLEINKSRYIALLSESNKEP